MKKILYSYNFIRQLISHCKELIREKHFKERFIDHSYKSMPVVLALFFTMTMGGLQAQCVPAEIEGYTNAGTYGTSTYFVSNFNLYPPNAIAAAAALGGHLVTIGDVGENNFVASITGGNYAWIGFTDQASEGNFVWVNGEAAIYNNWLPGEPNNDGGTEDWTLINWDGSGGWNDASNNWQEHKFVVEFVCDRDDDGISDEADNCVDIANPNQADNDIDGIGDLCDDDDDNDGCLDVDDDNPFDASVDTDGDGDANDCDSDDDNDGVLDGADSAPLDNFICQDLDGDGCDDCASGTVDASNDGTDTDGDGLCDGGDPDDDYDGIEDACDSNTLVNNFIFTTVGNLPVEWLCGNNPNKPKVFICHTPPGNPTKTKTICVSPIAVQAHLDHGCMLGECYSCPGSSLIINPNNSNTHSHFIDKEHLELDVYPNPATDNLNILLHGERMTGAQIIIYDKLGKFVMAENLEEDQATLDIDLNDNKFRTGFYLVTMVSGESIISKRIMVLK